jgi:release factor glutamine methyltransferase
LFVPDDDPLLFYRAIARFAKETLQPSGKLYFEVNAQYAEDVRNLLIQHGYRQVTIREDSFGKPRFVRAAYL